MIETYTIDYAGPAPRGVVVGRLATSGARFVAMTAPDDAAMAQTMIAADPLGAKVHVELNPEGRSIIKKFVPL